MTPSYLSPQGLRNPDVEEVEEGVGDTEETRPSKHRQNDAQNADRDWGSMSRVFRGLYQLGSQH